LKVAGATIAADTFRLPLLTLPTCRTPAVTSPSSALVKLSVPAILLPRSIGRPGVNGWTMTRPAPAVTAWVSSKLSVVRVIGPDVLLTGAFTWISLGAPAATSVTEPAAVTDAPIVKVLLAVKLMLPLLKGAVAMFWLRVMEPATTVKSAVGAMGEILSKVEPAVVNITLAIWLMFMAAKGLLEALP